MSDKTIVYLGLGSNSPDARTQLQNAVHALSEHDHISLIRCSSLYRSDAVGLDEPVSLQFINMVCSISTDLCPYGLLRVCATMETNAGRRREPGLVLSRPLDIDILFYGDLVLDEPDLTVPHPAALQRDFVVLPLQEILPKDWREPQTSTPVDRLQELICIRSGASKLTV